MRLATALPALALLAACATVPRIEPPPAKPWAERRAELQALRDFELRGRVAVMAGEEGFNASLRWLQEQETARLALDGPFGAGGLELLAQGENLELRTARGERLDGEAARAELERRLGFAVPLGSLRYWVLGAPDPLPPAEESLDADQRLARLEQTGWIVDFDRYVLANGRWLPQRLTARRADARVRLVVDRWLP
jgi:outer membrane lipoprotein LolB